MWLTSQPIPAAALPPPAAFAEPLNFSKTSTTTNVPYAFQQMTNDQDEEESLKISRKCISMNNCLNILPPAKESSASVGQEKSKFCCDASSSLPTVIVENTPKIINNLQYFINNQLNQSIKSNTPQALALVENPSAATVRQPATLVLSQTFVPPTTLEPPITMMKPPIPGQPISVVYPSASTLLVEEETETPLKQANPTATIGSVDSDSVTTLTTTQFPTLLNNDSEDLLKPTKTNFSLDGLLAPTPPSSTVMSHLSLTTPPALSLANLEKLPLDILTDTLLRLNILHLKNAQMSQTTVAAAALQQFLTPLASAASAASAFQPQASCISPTSFYARNHLEISQLSSIPSHKPLFEAYASNFNNLQKQQLQPQPTRATFLSCKLSDNSSTSTTSIKALTPPTTAAKDFYKSKLSKLNNYGDTFAAAETFSESAASPSVTQNHDYTQKRYARKRTNSTRKEYLQKCYDSVISSRNSGSGSRERLGHSGNTKVSYDNASSINVANNDEDDDDDDDNDVDRSRTSDNFLLPPPKKKWIKHYLNANHSMHHVQNSGNGGNTTMMTDDVSPAHHSLSSSQHSPPRGGSGSGSHYMQIINSASQQGAGGVGSHHHHHHHHATPRRRTISSTSNGAGTREVHNKLEKNRRAHLKECYEALKNQLSLKDEDRRKTSNLAILGEALKCVQSYQKHAHDLEAECEHQANDKINKQKRILSLKRELGPKYEQIFSGIFPDIEMGSIPSESEPIHDMHSLSSGRGSTLYSSSSSLSSGGSNGSNSSTSNTMSSPVGAGLQTALPTAISPVITKSNNNANNTNNSNQITTSTSPISITSSNLVLQQQHHQRKQANGNNNNNNTTIQAVTIPTQGQLATIAANSNNVAAGIAATATATAALLTFGSSTSSMPLSLTAKNISATAVTRGSPTPSTPSPSPSSSSGVSSSSSLISSSPPINGLVINTNIISTNNNNNNNNQKNTTNGPSVTVNIPNGLKLQAAANAVASIAAASGTGIGPDNATAATIIAAAAAAANSQGANNSNNAKMLQALRGCHLV